MRQCDANQVQARAAVAVEFGLLLSCLAEGNGQLPRPLMLSVASVCTLVLSALFRGGVSLRGVVGCVCALGNPPIFGGGGRVLHLQSCIAVCVECLSLGEVAVFQICCAIKTTGVNGP
jgi:hypothetical protein